MNFNQRINSFIKLGEYLNNQEFSEFEDISDQASYKNPWFTPENIRLSFKGLENYLSEQKLKKGLVCYDMKETESKRVGLVMAGNIPMVGIHDFLCVLVSGHQVVAKLSSQDDVLIPFIAKKLTEIDPTFGDRIHFVDRLTEIDAVIATGSDNTARYFNYYFSKYPHIIRKNRTSVAVLDGTESEEDVRNLSHDIFSYFGMGCRNVSKLFVNKGTDIKQIISQLEHYKHIADHHKYHNNYHYQRSIMLVNQTAHLDNGFALFIEDTKLTSPLSVVFFEYYDDLDVLKQHLDLQKDKIQCIVSSGHQLENAVLPGKAQYPELSDYADNIDTMKFLLNL